MSSMQSFLLSRISILTSNTGGEPEVYEPFQSRETVVLLGRKEPSELEYPRRSAVQSRLKGLLLERPV